MAQYSDVVALLRAVPLFGGLDPASSSCSRSPALR